MYRYNIIYSVRILPDRIEVKQSEQKQRSENA